VATLPLFAAGLKRGTLLIVMVRQGSWLELVSRVIETIEAELDRSRWLPLTVLAAFSYAVYFAADVALQIYSMHPVIVFVLVGGGPPQV
jgi:hypothetical protein